MGWSHSQGHENLLVPLTAAKLQREGHGCVSSDDGLALYEAPKHKLVKIVIAHDCLSE